jgi:hypothetical protein
MAFFVRIHKRCGKTPMAQADLAETRSGRRRYALARPSSAFGQRVELAAT